MNPFEVQALICEAIENRPPSSSDKWYLAIKGDELVCIPRGELPVLTVSFGIVTEEDGRLGTVPKELNRIVAKIFVYMESTKKCLKPHKP